MLRKRLYILSFVLLLFLPANAQIEGAGSSVFHFMGLPASARLNALGGENVSIADGDVSMAYMNPALLTSETDKVLQLNFAYYLAGTMFGTWIAMFIDWYVRAGIYIYRYFSNKWTEYRVV